MHVWPIDSSYLEISWKEEWLCFGFCF
jgi:hypothetical protein